MARVTDETVIGHLNYVDDLVQQADQASLAVLASSELGPMIQALRAMLGDHTPDERGRCHRCRPWWRLRWQRQHPCRVWALAYHHLVAAPRSPAPANRPGARRRRPTMNPTTKPNPATTKTTYDQAWARLAEPATTTRDAHRLEALLDLPPEAPDPSQAWHAWPGCGLSQISAHHPVLVHITAAIGAPREVS